MPKIGVVEKTDIVLTVPILLIPCKKSKSAPPNPETDMTTMIGHKVGSMLDIALHFPSASAAANMTRPPTSDFIIAILAGLTLEVSRLLKLLSIDHINIDASIIRLPALNSITVSDTFKL